MMTRQGSVVRAAVVSTLWTTIVLRFASPALALPAKDVLTATAPAAAQNLERPTAVPGGKNKQQSVSGGLRRDKALCEARERIDEWFRGGAKQTELVYADGSLQIRVMEEKVSCGGVDAPVIFANFTIHKVDPRHVLAAAADTSRLAVWSSQVKSVLPLFAGNASASRGVKTTYAASPFADRVFYEWHFFDIDQEEKDIWFASSTSDNAKLRSSDGAVDGSGFLGLQAPVEGDSCLTAYHIKRMDGRATSVIVTFTVNPHAPWVLSSSMVTQITWRRAVEYLHAMMMRVQFLATQRTGMQWSAPSELRPPRNASLQAECYELKNGFLEAWDAAAPETRAYAGHSMASQSQGQLQSIRETLPAVATAVATASILLGFLWRRLRTRTDIRD
eukprot:TRINITY_DN80933_c0_g1_i1.p1 TRINITY_DN80933_c0_g1~~TRINITY_DN80933_c0_g1_i1.p1  ORF type:complete len:389 (-),score=45.91 TRINITY_DN80933_c0_g1_i1:487-1653(-)